MASRTVYSERLIVEGVASGVSGTIGPAICARCQEFVFYIEGSAGVASGVVTLEEASHADYAGTWEAVEAVTVLSAEAVVKRVSGVAGAIRARISTVIGSGNVTVTVICN